MSTDRIQVSGEFLTRIEVAELLRVSRRTVDRYITAGILPASKLPGRGVRIALADAEALLTPKVEVAS